MPTAQEILDFWFGKIDSDGHVVEDQSWLWWKKNPEVDAEITEKYDAFVQAVARGEHDDWAGTPDGRMALIIALDQFTRNMYRDSAQMYACDAKAQQLTLDGIANGDDRKLALIQRVFFYLPLEHAEDRARQAKSLEMYQILAADAPDHLRETYDGYINFAERHKVIVDRFGHFPHRNEILGRASTAEEIEFLQEPGSSF